MHKEDDYERRYRNRLLVNFQREMSAIDHLKALEHIAAKNRFRMPVLDESWRQYVDALADHVERTDSREATEIRYGLAWM